MQKYRATLKNAAKELAAKMTVQAANEWPPDCLIIAYQPMRPYNQDYCQPHNNSAGPASLKNVE